jgi:predicted amidohydrolase
MKQRVACVQMTSTDDVKANLQAAKKLIAEAVRDEARLVVLPEMFAIMGMDQEKIHARVDWNLIEDFLHDEALRHGIWLVGGTIPVPLTADKDRVNAACLVFDDKGELAARYDKIHLFDVSIPGKKEAYSESKTIAAGEKVVVVNTPFGKLGLAVCYDLRFPEFFRKMQEECVEVIALPAAFTFTTGSAHWDVLVRARAIENLCYVVAACQTGTHHNGRRTFGHSMIVSPWGEVEGMLPEVVGVVVADLDLEYLRKVRSDFPVLGHRRF